MKQKRISTTLRTMAILFACTAIFGFTEGDARSDESPFPEARLSQVEFHSNVATIISGKILSQKNIARLMKEAELRKADDESASEYVENYMNANFRGISNMMSSVNRVSIAAPGQADQNESVACNQTALEEVISNTVGYYYAFAVQCDGTYDYDARDYTGGSTVYVRAEAGPSILTAFILF